MKLRSMALALALACPTVSGQVVAPSHDDPSVVVWRLSDGGDRLDAYYGATSQPTASLLVGTPGPVSDALGASALPGVAGALRLDLAGGTQVSVGANRRWSPSALVVRAPWCDGIAGLLAMSGSTSDCVALDVSSAQPQFDRTEAQLVLGAGALDLALAFGVSSAGIGDSWLLPPDSLSSYRLSPLGLGTAEPALGATALGSSQDVSVLGTWRLDPMRAINIGAAVGQSSLLLPAFRMPLELEQAALGVGMSRGAFSGSIVGRVVRSTGQNPAAAMRSGLDIGVSWRTPWQGELSFGARNLLSRGTSAVLPDAASEALDESTARTPYVRYKQDL